MKRKEVMKKALVWSLLLFGLWPVSVIGQEEANYDESKIPPFTLPPLLESKGGETIATVEQWEEIRRPELLALFGEQMFGKTPQGDVEVSYRILDDYHSALEGSSTRKQIEITFTKGDIRRKALLLMYLPNFVKTKVPLFFCCNFQGNQTVSMDPDIIPTTDAERGAAQSRWPLEKITSAGYGIATVCYSDFFPDNKEGYKESVLSLFGYESEEEIPADGGQAISAWAWGISRVLDYLETDWQVDASKVILMGHSRLGKAALWAGAQDTRFGMVISNESGCGGAALSKRSVGETVGAINRAFPHWFCKNFRLYNNKEGELPFDQHALLALIAPRPLYVASAVEDRWADPKGEFFSASYAGEVYKLYGMQGLETETMPAVDTPLMNRVGYHIRSGVHDVTDFDWDCYILFADKWLK